MSQDLLAAFGEPPPKQSNFQAPSSAKIGGELSFFDDFGTTTPTAPVAVQEAEPWTDFVATNAPADDDDWGEFEDANAAPITVSEPKKTPSSAPSKYQYGLDELGSPSVEVPKKQPNIMNLDLLSMGNSTPIGRQVGLGKLKEQRNPKDPDVLFDASEESEEDDDDFGNFEEPESKAPVPVTHNVLDLLGLDDDLDFTPAHTSSKERAPESIHALANPDPPKPDIPDKFQDEESWDDFSSWEQNTTSIQQETPKPVLVPVQAAAMALPQFIGAAQVSDEALPPANIPPPSLLLSLFPELFASIDTALLRRISSLDQPLRQQIFKRPETVTSFRGYLTIITVCARIIAGRKLRWKRDVLLSQSMRIGSASSGKISGMKITSVDKAEVAKEERELAEVLRAWTQQVGRLKAALADAKRANPNVFGLVPELKDTMSVETAKETDGGVPSAKPCALCGLKRNERVLKADVDVQDSFGEWWIERTNMHRGRF